VAKQVVERIAEELRGRILRAVHADVLKRGDRLPSSRDLAGQLSADPRDVLAAYRRLAGEGLVELRERSGIYVAAKPGTDGGLPPTAQGWLATMLATGIGREIPVPHLHEWMRRATASKQLRAVTIAATIDQSEGICRDLRGDYGLVATGITSRKLHRHNRLPAALRRADLIVTTEGLAAKVKPLAKKLQKPCVVITVRPDLLGIDWQLLLRAPVYVVMTDPKFLQVLRDFFQDGDALENLRPIILGRDDVSAIPAGAPTYVTRSARARLGGAEIPGRVVPPARFVSAEASREIVDFIVRANLNAG
jgi:DNA-binding transcriptional regulator YhcF (GntR family)